MNAVRVICLGLGVAAVSAQGIAADGRTTLTCEQVFAVAQAAVRFRDQGQRLDQVLDSLNVLDAQKRLDAAQMQVLRTAVSTAYLGSATPEEIGIACLEAR